MVFQSYALYPTMTARRNMTFGMEGRGAPKAEQDAAIKRVKAAVIHYTRCLAASVRTEACASMR